MEAAQELYASENFSRLLVGSKDWKEHRVSFFSSRRNWDSPNPSPAGECAPRPLGSGGRGTLAGERGVGRVPIPTRGHRLWYSLYIIYVLCGKESW